MLSLWGKVLFLTRNVIFCKEMLTSTKLRRSWYQNIYFLKLNMCVYLPTKFQVSSMILTSFKQGRLSPIPKWTPKKPTLIRVKYFLKLYRSHLPFFQNHMHSTFTVCFGWEELSRGIVRGVFRTLSSIWNRVLCENS